MGYLDFKKQAANGYQNPLPVKPNAPFLTASTQTNKKEMQGAVNAYTTPQTRWDVIEGKTTIPAQAAGWRQRPSDLAMKATFPRSVRQQANQSQSQPRTSVNYGHRGFSGSQQDQQAANDRQALSAGMDAPAQQPTRIPTQVGEQARTVPPVQGQQATNVQIGKPTQLNNDQQMADDWGALSNEIGREPAGSVAPLEGVRGKAQDAYADLPKPVQLGIQDALDSFKPGNNVFEMGKLDPNLFNSDEFRKLTTNEERYAYLQRAATKAGVYAAMYNKDDKGNVKVTSIRDILQDPKKLHNIPQQVFDQPEFFSSLEKAVESGDMDTLEFLQWAKDKYAKAATAKTNGTETADPFSITMSKEQEARLTKAASKAMWNNIQKDPLNNMPRAASLFLRQQGLDGLADFASNPFSFFASLAAILLGGGALLFGGLGQQEPQQVVINNGGQPDTRMSRVPYAF